MEEVGRDLRIAAAARLRRQRTGSSFKRSSGATLTDCDFSSTWIGPCESRLLPRQIPSFNFYCARRSVETMLKSWDAVTTARLAAMPVTRIDLIPDDRSEIAKVLR